MTDSLCIDTQSGLIGITQVIHKLDNILGDVDLEQGQNEIDNSGSIGGDVILGDDADIVFNPGVILGEVSLGDGNDFFDALGVGVEDHRGCRRVHALGLQASDVGALQQFVPPGLIFGPELGGVGRLQLLGLADVDFDRKLDQLVERDGFSKKFP